MITAPESIDLALVPINLGVAHEKPFAKPDRGECWRRDTVSFRCHDPFTVEFKGESPFQETTLEGVKTNGLFVAEATVRDDAPDDDHAYPYALTVDGHTVDPEIVVRGDPTG